MRTLGAVLALLVPAALGWTEDTLHASQTGSVMTAVSVFPKREFQGAWTDFWPVLAGREDVSGGFGENWGGRIHGGFQVVPQEPRLNRILIQDLYLGYFNDAVDVRAGYQIFPASGLEVLSPLDILNQRDYGADFFRPEKVGEPALRWNLAFSAWGSHSVSLTELAWFTPVKLPPAGTADDLFAQNPWNYQEDQAVYSSSLGISRPQAALTDWFQSEGWGDVDVLLFNGYRKFPVFRPLSLPPGRILVVPEYREVLVAGLGYRKELGSWSLAGEGAWTRYQEPLRLASGASTDGYVQYGFGASSSFASPLTALGELTLVFELIGDSTSGKADQDVEPGHLYRNHAVLGVKHLFNDPWRTELQGSLTTDVLRGDTVYLARLTTHGFENLRWECETGGLLWNTNSVLRGLQYNHRLKVSAGVQW